MKERLEKRLQELKGEFKTGQQMLYELEQKQTDLNNRLLRISGAMQAIEEELQHYCENQDSEKLQDSSS